LKKYKIVQSIGGMLILISFAPFLQTRSFQFDLELIWFILGLTWVNSGFIMKKNSIYRPCDRPLYILHIFYLLGICYILLIRPESWNKTYYLFDFKIEPMNLITISIVLSALSLISHFSTKRYKSTD